jgi:stalled ribosome alternative rescue factor ArfA
MKKKKRKLKKRNPEAQALVSPLFRQRVVPKKQKPKETPPDIKEWE